MTSLAWRGGTPSDRAFAHFVAGKDSLSITCEVEAGTIQAKCTEVLAAYKLTVYRHEFAWVDNMRRVAEKEVVADLNQNLFDALADLRAGKLSDLHMAPPEIVDYTEGSELHYNGFGSHGANFHSLSIEDYVTELNRCAFAGDMTEIKERDTIKAKGDDEEEFSEKWRVYNCFVFETTLGTGKTQQHFVLFAGIWYRVEKHFKDRVEAFFDAIHKATIIARPHAGMRKNS